MPRRADSAGNQAAAVTLTGVRQRPYTQWSGVQTPYRSGPHGRWVSVWYTAISLLRDALVAPRRLSLEPPAAAGQVCFAAPRGSKRSRGRKRRSSRSKARSKTSDAQKEKGRREADKPLVRKWTGLILLAVCGLSLLVSVLSFDSLPSIIGDNAEFMILARSLAAGNGFRYINHPANRPGTKYPLGFPALLAGWILIFGQSIVSMKVCVLACCVAGAGFTFILGSRLVGWSYALLASLLVSLSAIVANYSCQVLSDVPYMLFSLIGIYLLVSGYRQRWHLLAGLAVCIWAYVVRSAGMSLVLAAAIFLFIKGRKREALATIGVAALISILWSVRNYSMTGEGSRYMQVLLAADPYDPDKGALTFSGIITRVFTNAGGYLGGLLPVTVLPSFIDATAGHGAGPVGLLVSVLAMIMVVLGGWSLRKKGLLTNIYLLIYFAVYLVWPQVWKSERFMVPVAPLVAIYFVWGLRTVFSYFGVRKGVILGICAALVLSNLFSLPDFISRARGYPPGWAKYLETAQWARSNTDPQAVVMCRKPFLYNLFSERMTVGYPFTRDHTKMRGYLLETRPDYIVLDDFGGGVSSTDVYVVPVLQDMIQYVGLAYETGEPVNKLLKFNLPQGLVE